MISNASPLLPIAARIARFHRDQSGAMTVFGINMLMMVLVGGVGGDLMRGEMAYVRLHNTTDRAVVAPAEERISTIEISRVLDISGSTGSNSKIARMRDAAEVFVETAVREETEDLVSVSLVPYTEPVNAGADIFNSCRTTKKQDFSPGIEFPESEYQVTEINMDIVCQQGQHFRWGYDSQNRALRPMCPNDWHAHVTAHSQDVDALRGQIIRLQARSSTSIFIGMKWAIGPLGPDFNPTVRDLNSAGLVDDEVTDRPVADDDVETLKAVALMTDGQAWYSNRLADWAYEAPTKVVHWSRNNSWHFMHEHVPWQQRLVWSRTNISTPQSGDPMLDRICDTAKAQRSVVWSIGFEVNDHGAAQIQNCASSPSHFFPEEGVETTAAFEVIAHTINQLRLNQ